MPLRIHERASGWVALPAALAIFLVVTCSGVAFAETVGWAVGGNGVVLRSTDGGVVWTQVSVPSGAILTGIHFEDGNHGWISGGQVVLRTTNGGSDWVDEYQGGGALNGIFFPTLLTGWAVGSSGVIVKSVDGGDTWTDQYPPTSAVLTDLYFATSQLGWVSGGQVILKTTNGGTDWVDKYNGGSVVNDVYFLNSTTGWAATNGGGFLKTTDGGETWIETVISGADLKAIYFSDTQHGWIAGGMVILRTENGGTSWTDQYNGGAFLEGIFFADPMTGWASGSNGTIVRTTDGGVTWTDASSVPTSATLREVVFVETAGPVQYYLEMVAGPGGSVSPPSGWYDAGAVVEISADEDPGYSFEAWTGSGNGSYSGPANPAAVTMNGNITETASFTYTGTSVVYVDWRNAGDPDQNGSPEHPYSTVAAGVANVDPGGRVIIAYGSYDEVLLIPDRLTMEATGGTVVIGQ